MLVVEPRRLAAVSLAAYVADTLAEDGCGDRVGYAVRFDHCVGPASEIVFVTPGIALNWLADGRLDRFASIIIDEFHERRWDTDLLLALLLEQGRYRLVLTSATLDGVGLADYLRATHLSVQAQAYPVEVRYAEQHALTMPTGKDLVERVVSTVLAVAGETEGHLLVFCRGGGKFELFNNGFGALWGKPLLCMVPHPLKSSNAPCRPMANSGLFWRRILPKPL
nr:hypothetical protein [Alkalilimnicola ehrlichii]